MGVKFYVQTFEQLIVITDAAQGFEIFKNNINDARGRHIPQNAT